MPYIKKIRRQLFDPEIEKLQQKLVRHCAEEGDYNYIITRIISTMLVYELKYKMLARATGILNNVVNELYRRVGGPYENNAINKNGDIIEFEKINAMIHEDGKESEIKG